MIFFVQMIFFVFFISFTDGSFVDVHRNKGSVSHLAIQKITFVYIKTLSVVG